MSLRRAGVVGLLALLCACGRPPPVAVPVDAEAKLPVRKLTLKDRRASAAPREGEDIRASISLIEVGEAGIDRRIQRWVGSLCPRSPETNAEPDSASACLALLMQDCLAMAAQARNTEPARCTYEAEVKAELNGHYLLSLSHESYYDSGGAHGLPNIAYLNIDRKTGNTLALSDLVSLPAETLRGLLEQNLRQTLNIDAETSLKQQGFFEDSLAPTDNVLIDRLGLRFTYGAYEIAPYAMGLPNIRIPYAELAAHLAEGSPLRRLPALSHRTP